MRGDTVTVSDLVLAELMRDTVPIDDAARDGRFRIVFGPPAESGRREFAVVRWAGDLGWAFSNDHPLNFDPEGYLPIKQGELP